jgi:hypothetical protein
MALEPVCGCDQVTYWNKDIAAEHGVNVMKLGVCPAAVALACSDLVKCPEGATCNMNQQVKANCATAVKNGGKCWGIPKTCPPVSTDRVRSCEPNYACTTFCEAIKSHAPFFSSTTCN